ncbi:MAG: rod shape-determining protein MreC [Zoogloeaceae bacterium]|jgi:rod shape-determining protein MreC|nr:rod shape-determining protein MreC [Zoogloeaceae bacterium]
MAAVNEAPPFFRNGPTPFARLCFYVACALALMILDLRFHALETARKGFHGLLEPLRNVAQAPVRLFSDGSRYFLNLERVRAENQALRKAQLKSSPIIAHYAQLEAENRRLNALLGLRAQPAATGQIARVRYTARDPFTRRVFLDKGLREGIAAGSPVIDTQGVIGQVTRVFPFSAEVTLLTDKDQAIPVQVERTGQRSFIFGLGNGLVELKYIPINADIRAGDRLITSGIDGVYQPGFPVARVIEVTHDSNDAFARIIARPLSAAENHHMVMILATTPESAPHPEDARTGPVARETQ